MTLLEGIYSKERGHIFKNHYNLYPFSFWFNSRILDGFANYTEGTSTFHSCQCPPPDSSLLLANYITLPGSRRRVIPMEREPTQNSAAKSTTAQGAGSVSSEDKRAQVGKENTNKDVRAPLEEIFYEGQLPTFRSLWIQIEKPALLSSSIMFPILLLSVFNYHHLRNKVLHGVEKLHLLKIYQKL